MTRDHTSATLVDTCEALHAVAEHVLAAARHSATGRIGLRAVPGGFGTPPFPAGAGVERTVSLHGAEIVVTDDGLARRQPLTTLREAATFVGIEPGAPADVYPPATGLDLDRPLAIEPSAAATVADWIGLVNEALIELVRGAGIDDPDAVQLWPEHFDISATVEQVNFGGSPGDAGHPQPYLYVGPWSPPRVDGGYWNEPFGASRPAALVPDVITALVFFNEGRRLLSHA